MVPIPAGAIGLGVSPGTLELSAFPGGTDAKTLHVINHAGSTSRFEVYAEGPHPDWLTIRPAEFTLNPGGVQEVNVSLKAPLTIRTTSHRMTICVVTMSSDSELRFGAGVKVPADVKVALDTPLIPIQWWLFAAALMITATVSALVIRSRRARAPAQTGLTRQSAL